MNGVFSGTSCLGAQDEERTNTLFKSKTGSKLGFLRSLNKDPWRWGKWYNGYHYVLV